MIGQFGMCGCCRGYCVSPESTTVRPDLYCKYALGGCTGAESKISLNNIHYLVSFYSYATQSQIADELIGFWNYFDTGEVWYRRAIYMVDYIDQDDNYYYFSRRDTDDGTHVEVVIRKEVYNTTGSTGITSAGGGLNYYSQLGFVDSILIYKTIDGTTYGHKLVGRKKSDSFDLPQFCPSTDHPYRNVHVVYSIPSYTGRVEVKAQTYFRRWHLDDTDTATIIVGGMSNCDGYNGDPADGSYTGTISKIPMEELGLLGVHPSYASEIPDIGDARMAISAAVTLHGSVWPSTSPADHTQTVALNTVLNEDFCLGAGAFSGRISSYGLITQVNHNQVWHDYPTQQLSPYKILTGAATQYHILTSCADVGAYWDETHTYDLIYDHTQLGDYLEAWFCVPPAGTVSVRL